MLYKGVDMEFFELHEVSLPCVDILVYFLYECTFTILELQQTSIKALAFNLIQFKRRYHLVSKQIV